MHRRITPVHRRITPLSRLMRPTKTANVFGLTRLVRFRNNRASALCRTILVRSLRAQCASGTCVGACSLAWGWRVPFFLSIVLVAIGLYIRLRILETPVFKASQDRRKGSASASARDAVRAFRCLTREARAQEISRIRVQQGPRSSKLCTRNKNIAELCPLPLHHARPWTRVQHR